MKVSATAVMTARPLPASDFRRVPWKNGGGVSIHIAGEPGCGAAPDDWSGTVWNFTRTFIRADGPFSDLSGFDRVLTVLSGRGLVLAVQDGPELDVREPLRPVRFAGEWPIRSRLEDGVVEVLNLIADRNLAVIDLSIVSGGESIDLPAGTAVFHAFADAAELRIEDGQAMGIPGGDALLVSAGARMRVEINEGDVAVASVVRRAPRTSGNP